LISIDPRVEERFPGLRVLLSVVEGLRVREADEGLEEVKGRVVEEVKAKFTAERLKDHPVFRAYRDFFWRMGLDPTKIRPAGEALVRRTLVGKPVPRINTAVDAYNLASMETGVALAAFDLSKLKPPIRLRFAEAGEAFKGIGMAEAKRLRGGEVVVSDREKLIAIYPYRDSDDSKVTLETRSIALLACGVPGLEPSWLEEAEGLAVRYITQWCGGSVRGRWTAP
jgi:DNA/RNA-binding domain of Phe-tRNA-synthetase-like protein